MAIETERKFLVIRELFPPDMDGLLLRQAYMHISAEKSIRVRIAGHKAYLTVKGPDLNGRRAEFEYEIPVEDAEYMFENLVSSGVISKIRRFLIWKKKLWEVDEFLERHQGLWLAEVELDDIKEPLDMPPWVGREVTGEKEYYNTYLSDHPYISG
ncbi:MAG: CYTH domain-containing protein [Bacteroidales bacterium]|nr:CYTH domain-containing protein [Bacteroidales bacterium]